MMLGETSTWDVLDTFPKLRSRARENEDGDRENGDRGHRACTEFCVSRYFPSIDIFWHSVFEHYCEVV